MLNRLILKVTNFQLPPPKRLGTVVKIILGGHHAPPPPMSNRVNGAYKFHEIRNDALVLLSYQVNEAFCCTESLYEVKN